MDDPPPVSYSDFQRSNSPLSCKYQIDFDQVREGGEQAPGVVLAMRTRLPPSHIPRQERRATFSH